MKKAKPDPLNFPIGPESAPPPMFAEVRSIACKGRSDTERGTCAHYAPRGNDRSFSMRCKWWTMAERFDCANSIACMQALTAALAGLKGETK